MGLAIGALGTLGSAYLSSQASKGASNSLIEGQNEAANVAQRGGIDQNFLNLLNMALNRQSMLGPMQNQLGANNLLGLMLGINTGATGTGATGTGANPLAVMRGGTAPGVATTPQAGGSSITGNQITLPGTGQIITLPPGFDLNSVFGPVTASSLNLTPGQTNALSGSLLQTGVTQQDIQNQLGGGLDLAGDAITKALKAQSLQTGSFGGGGATEALGQNLYELYGLQAPQIANQMRQQQLGQIFNELQGYATGSPAAVTSAASTGQAGTNALTGQIGSQYNTLGQIASNIGAAGAQGILGQGNAWSTGINNVSSLLTKYLQSQGGGGGNQFATYDYGNMPDFSGSYGGI